MQIHREYAEKLVAKMKALHSQPMRLVPVQESDFPDLDLASYRHFRTTLEAQGYRFAGDFESLAVTDAPGSVMARTMNRSMLSADGRIAAGHYQVRPKMERLAANLIRGLLNFRFLDAPASFLGNLSTKQMYDFSSEVGQNHVLTSNAELVAKFSAPASVDAEYLANFTRLEAVRSRHVARLAAAEQRAATPATILSDREDIVAMHERLREQKAAHRAACGWITHDELLRFTNGNVVLADSIFEEVQAINRQGN
jgi:hypothetical protein